VKQQQRHQSVKAVVVAALCFRCGRSGHVIANCYARTHTSGSDFKSSTKEPRSARQQQQQQQNRRKTPRSRHGIHHGVVNDAVRLTSYISDMINVVALDISSRNETVRQSLFPGLFVILTGVQEIVHEIFLVLIPLSKTRICRKLSFRVIFRARKELYR
jgi:hypothetical protein